MNLPFRPLFRLHVIGYPPCKNEYFFERTLDFKLWSVIAQYSERKPTLVFCSSRKATVAAASKLLEACSQNGSSYVTNNAQKDRLFEAAKKVQNDPQLSACFLNGVAFHHAGMNVENRNLVEKLFCTGEDVMVVAATSTLAVGVNLPAYLVVIKSTTFWTQSNGVEECSPLMIRQMIGRAGRPQFGDSSAVAVIMTQQTKVSSYESILECEVAITESVLHKHLCDTLLNEIVLGTISSFKTALFYLQHTFLAVRIHANTSHYTIQPISERHQIEQQRNQTQNEKMVSNPLIPSWTSSNILHPLLRTMGMASLASLMKYECITVENQNLLATDLGRALSRYFVSFQSIQAIFNYFKHSTTDLPDGIATSPINDENVKDISSLNILECISSSPQFSDVIVRRAEKKELKDFSMKSRFPIGKGIKQKEKVMILIQSVFQGPFSDSSLNSDAQSAISTAISLCACMVQFFLDRGWFYTIHKALLLLKSLRKQTWSCPGPQTSQIPLITKEMAQKLSQSGYRTLLDLTAINSETLQRIIGNNAIFAQNVLLRLQQVPSYNLSLQIVHMESQKMLNFEAHAINAVRNEERMEFRWLVLGQNGNVIAHRIIPLSNQHGESFTFSISLPCDIRGDIEIYFLSDEWIGFDIVGAISMERSGYQHLMPQNEFQDPYDDTIPKKKRKRSQMAPETSSSTSLPHICNHKCKNKFICKHDCCKLHPDVKASGNVRLELPGPKPLQSPKPSQITEHVYEPPLRKPQPHIAVPPSKPKYSSQNIHIGNRSQSSQSPSISTIPPQNDTKNSLVKNMPLLSTQVITTKPGKRGSFLHFDSPTISPGHHVPTSVTHSPQTLTHVTPKFKAPTLRPESKIASEISTSFAHTIQASPSSHPYSTPVNSSLYVSSMGREKLLQPQRTEIPSNILTQTHRPLSSQLPSSASSKPSYATPNGVSSVNFMQQERNSNKKGWNDLLDWELDAAQMEP
jgi:hypothetical protein